MNLQVMGKRDYQIFFILILFVTITLAFSMIIPVFNAPDEPFHFEFIQFLAKNKRLPNQTIKNRSISSEGFNPPLYYFINAIFLDLFTRNKASDIQVHNYQDILNFYRDPNKGFRRCLYPPLNPKYIKWGQGQDKNMFLTTQEDQFPFSGSIRVIHLLRLLSVLFGAVTIFFIYTTTRTLFPHDKNLALITVCICAFNPQFNFLCGSLNNDNLIILFATLSIWFLTKLILYEDQNPKWIIMLLGIFIGIGLISKINIFSLTLIIILGIIYTSFVKEQKKIQGLIVNLVLFLGPLIGIAGWFFIRNIRIYGFNDPLGWHLQAIQNPGLIMPDQFRALFFKKIFFQRLFTSFWGQFDWLTISLPNWIYWIYGLISMTGILGLINALCGKNHPKKRKICILLYLAAILISIANLIVLNFTFTSAQARLIFPVLACICVFIAIGMDIMIKYLAKWTKIKAQIPVYGFIVFLLLLDLYALFRIIYPVYR